MINLTCLPSTIKNEVDAFDLVELFKQQQNLLLNQLSTGSTLNNQLGVLKCIARMPQPGPFEAYANIKTNYQDHASSPTPTTQRPPDEHHQGPNVVVIPQVSGDDSNDDDSPIQPEVEAPEEPPAVDDQASTVPPDDGSISAEGAQPVEQTEASGDDYEQPEAAVEEAASLGNVNKATDELLYQDKRRNSSRRSVPSWSQKFKLLSKLRPRSELDHNQQLAHMRPATRLFKPIEPRIRSKRQIGSRWGARDRSSRPSLVSSLAQLITQVASLRQQRRSSHQFNQLMRALMFQRLQQQPGFRNNPSLVRGVLDIILPVGTALATNLVRNSIQDLPIRLANMGQLVANLITLLTIENPVLLNEPLLTRILPTTPAQNRTNDPVTQLTSLLLNISNSLGSVASSVLPLEPALDELPPGLDSSASAQNSSLLAAGQIASPQASPKKARLAINEKQTGEESGDEEFVKRLNALTLGQVTASKTAKGTTVLETNSWTGASESPKSRKKRSVSSMMLFGPFRKFYVAMLLHRVMKRQSSLLSQAILGELVRRYIIPSVKSAIIGNGGASNPTQQLLNTAKQALLRASSSALGAPAPLIEPAAQQLQPNQSSSPPDARRTSVTELKLHQQLFKSSLLAQQTQRPFVADCQFVQNSDQAGGGLLDSIRFTAPVDYQQLIQLWQAPMAKIFAAAYENPPLSIDSEGSLSINLPISQTSLTIPSVPAFARLLDDSHLVNHTLRGLSTQNQLQSRAHHRSHRPFAHSFGPRVKNQFHARPAHAMHSRRARPRARPDLAPPQLPSPGFEMGDAEFTFESETANGLDGQIISQSAIGELLKQASPAQLMELLNQMNLTAPQVRNQEDGSDQSARQQPELLNSPLHLMQSLLSAAIKSDPLKSGDGLAQRPQLANQATNSTKQTPDMLADELLNKTLSVWLEQMVGPEAFGEHKTNASSSSKPVEGLGQARDIQITLTSDNAAQLMDKLMDKLTGANKTSPSSGSLVGHTGDSGEQLPGKTTPFSDQPRKSALRAPVSFRPFALTNSSRPAQRPHDDSKDSEQTGLAQQSSIDEDDNYISTVYAGRQQQQHGHSGFDQVRSSGPLEEEESERLRKHRQRVSKTQVSVELGAILANQEVAPPHTDNRRQKQVSTLSQPTTNSPFKEHSNASAEFQGQQQQRLLDRREPLNNLAMALNVMNMVMLNQRLMSAANSSNWGLAQASSSTTPRPRASSNSLLASLNESMHAHQELRSLAALANLSMANNAGAVHNSTRSKKPTTTKTRLKSYNRANRPVGQPSKRPTTKSQDGSTITSTRKPVGVGNANETSSMEPEFEIINDEKVARAQQNRTENSNHRTSTNAIRLHSGLIHQSEANGTSSASRMLKYIYQPLTVQSTNSTTAGKTGAEAQQSSDRPSEPPESVEGENDHAARWNDVLQHLSLPA